MILSTQGPLFLLWMVLLLCCDQSTAFSPPLSYTVNKIAATAITPTRSRLTATLETQEICKVSNDQKDRVLQQIAMVAKQEAPAYADDFGLGATEAALYAVFRAIRMAGVNLGLQGEPFVLRRQELLQALGKNVDDNQDGPLDRFFTLQDFAKAVEDDFLDAARGSTDNRKGWKITNVSNPRGDSFEEARMTFEEVEAALQKGTVIMNAIGAHVPKLAAPSLACTDATALPNAINLYVTAANMRTSAPPHTDKQDVVVVQTSGEKHWRVFEPTNPSMKPTADMFARGKGDDSLPLHQLLSSDESKATNPNASNLLIETVLKMGDILFIPAAFPHTTSTAHAVDETSVHLTFNLDTHIWELDYLSARRLALQRACVVDTALGGGKNDNRYVGACNELPQAARQDLFAALPLGLLEDTAEADQLLETTINEVKRISNLVDETTASQVSDEIWRETMTRVRQQGQELLEIHRDMYLAAIQEGRAREAEDAMTAHLDVAPPKVMTPERMQRLSLFRVKAFYEKIEASKNALLEWSLSGTPSTSTGSNEASDTTTAPSRPTLPPDWATTWPLKVGDQVEADLGGAFFDATVTRVVGNAHDVQFFDGDVETGMPRAMLKLKTPPVLEDDSSDQVDTSNMTPKQLKRWRKEQEKKKKKQKKQ